MTPTYTYHGGQRVELQKASSKFIVRAQPQILAKHGFRAEEQASPNSSVVETREAELEAEMVRARAVAPTHHAYSRADTRTEFLITDRVIIKFKAQTSTPAMDIFAGKYGLILLNKYSDTEGIYQLTTKTGMNPVKLVVKLNEEEPELVERAEHDLNYRVQGTAITVPTDPFYARQWHLHPSTLPQVDARSQARVEEAWRLLDGFGSPTVVVGITDDGCKLSHEDFDSEGKFESWGYFQGSSLIDQSHPQAASSAMYQPGSNHGTSCAGVSAAETDGKLTVGAAPGCKLVPIKWESNGPSLFISDSKLRTAFDFLAARVDIISNSWGMSPVSNFSASLVDHIRSLALTGGRRGNGIVFVWAAGNENCPVNHRAAVDVPYTGGIQRNPDTGELEWVGVKTARTFEHNYLKVDGVLCVGALASTARRSHYSNYGTSLSLCAPSSNSHTYGRMTVQGRGIVTATGEGAFTTLTFGGTSSATPLVAGIAALVISANRNLSAHQVCDILMSTAAKDLNTEAYDKTPPAVFDTNTDWDVSPISPFDSGEFINNGSPNGTWSPWFGHGRVDAAAAVQSALALLPAPASLSTTARGDNKRKPKKRK